jgi:uncharacterized protein (DUF983 family)
MINLKLTMIAVVGSLFCFTVIDYFIVSMSFWQYLVIEVIMAVVHSFYNYVKNKHLTNT